MKLASKITDIILIAILIGSIIVFVGSVVYPLFENAVNVHYLIKIIASSLVIWFVTLAVFSVKKFLDFLREDEK